MFKGVAIKTDGRCHPGAGKMLPAGVMALAQGQFSRHPAAVPPTRSREQILGRRIGMGVCAAFGLAVALGPGVEPSQRLLGLLFGLACGLPVARAVWRRR